MKERFQIKQKETANKPDQSENDTSRIGSIIAEQKLLIVKFTKTGDQNLFAEFKRLAEEFQQIHDRHKLKISN